MRHSSYFFSVFIAFLLVFGGVLCTVQQSGPIHGKTMFNTVVFGKESEVAGDENGSEEEKEMPEATEAPKPTEISEPKETPEAREREAKNIHDEIKNEIETGRVGKVEINPSSETTGEGTLKVEKINGSSTEKAVPSSSTSLINIKDGKSADVSIKVNTDGTATLVNDDITVTTNYPVVIDPNSQTIAIKTPNGVVAVNTLPSQAVGNIGQTDKPTTIQSAVLGAHNGEVYYDLSGTQKRKFLGIIPITAHVTTKINADDGSVSSIDRPWFLDVFGFLYTT